MVLQDYKPCAPLNEWIKCYRIVHFNFEAGYNPPDKPYTPRPEQCIAFYPKSTETVKYPDTSHIIKNTKVALIGQHTKVNYREVKEEFLVIQVIFQAGALYRLTGIPANELLNEYIEADIVLGNDVHLANEQLSYCTKYNEMIVVLDLFFLNMSKSVNREKCRVDPLINLFNQNTSMSLDYLSSQAYYSNKQFERHFYLRTGVTPRFYQRLVRFDYAFRSRNLPNCKTWREIAWKSRYTDYQHLVKDYKEFTGFTPPNFHALGTPEESLGIAESFYEIEDTNMRH